MADGETGMKSDRQIDEWMREEAAMGAPDRLLEDVYARTLSARQVRRGWLGRLGSAGRGRRGVAGGRQRGLVGLTALVVVALLGLTIGARLGTAPGTTSVGASPSPSPVPSPTASIATPSAGLEHALVVARSHQTCARRGTLTVVPATASTPASAWVTCGEDSDEIVLGQDAVVRRTGLGSIATGGSVEWAIRGDSVVQLDADRSVSRSVRVGTPSAIAIGASTVWVLDPLTGRIASIGANGIDASLAPSPGHRLIALAFAAGSVWVLDQTTAELLQLDPRDGRHMASYPTAADPTLMASGTDALFVASPVSGTVVRIDVATGTAVSYRFALGADSHIDALAATSAGLLVGSRASVARLDPVTGAVLGVAVGADYVAGVAVDGSTLVVLTESGLLLEAELP